MRVQSSVVVFLSCLAARSTFKDFPPLVVVFFFGCFVFCCCWDTMAVGRGVVRGSRAAKGMTYRMVAPTLLLLVFVTTAVLLYGDSFASVPVSLPSLSFFLSFFRELSHLFRILLFLSCFFACCICVGARAGAANSLCEEPRFSFRNDLKICGLLQLFLLLLLLVCTCLVCLQRHGLLFTLLVFLVSCDPAP